MKVPSVSADAAALVGYVSPNQSRPADGQLEEDAELSRLRGTSQADEEVGRLTAWTTRKDYNTLVGIALPIQDWVGEDYHVIQFWEETTDSIPVMEHHADDMYAWLVTRFRERAQSLRLPIGMPETFIGLSVQAYRDGKAGYILYGPLDSLAGDLTDMPVRVQIEYHYGSAKLGMDEDYTQRMLAQELWASIHNDLNLYPGIGFARTIEGTIRHNTTSDAESFHNSMTVYLIVDPSVKIQEDQGRGTAINSGEDQARLLQYWAWARQEIAVGVALSIDNHAVEYWLNLVLDPLVDDDDGRAYALALQQLWLSKLRRMSPQIAAECDKLGQDFSYRMSCQGNALKVWSTPTANIASGLDKPLAETPVPKDKWVSREAVVLTYPQIPDQYAQKSAQILLGGRPQERYDDPEVQGGKIALIASNNNIVQKPPNSLDRMHASLPKQVAYDQRILSGENEIAGINCDIGESSDSQDFGGLDIADKVQVWMHTAAQVSIGGRKQVLENGADACDSESDSHGCTLMDVHKGHSARLKRSTD
jgi:hypothetical protein